MSVGLRGLVVLPVLARELGPGDYGIWAQILITVSLVLPFVMLGLPSAMVRFLAGEDDKKRLAKVVFTVLLSVFIASASVAILAGVLAGSSKVLGLPQRVGTDIVHMASVLLVLQALILSGMELFRIIGRIRTYALFTGMQNIIEVALIIFFVGFRHLGLEGALLGLTAGRGLILGLLLVWLVVRIGFAPPKLSLLRPYFLFGAPLILSTVFEVVVASSDRYVIGLVHGAAAVAIYTVAYNLGVVMFMMVYPLVYILSPTIFRYFETGEKEKTSTLLSLTLRYSLLLLIPSVVGLTLMGPHVLVMFATPAFVSPVTPFILFFVSFSVLFDAMRAIYGNILMLYKDTRPFVTLTIVAATLNLMLNLVLVPTWGIEAASVTTLLSYAVLGLGVISYSRKYFRVPFPWSSVGKSVVAALSMGVLLHFLNPIGPGDFVATIAVGIAVYCVALFMLRELGKKEVEILRSLVKSGRLS